MRRWWPVVIIVAVLGSALGVNIATRDSGNGAADGERSATTQHLVTAANLQACPQTNSDAKAVEGGLPDLTLPCLGDGPAVQLAALRGTPLVVNIWAGPCPPCKREAPRLQRFYDAAGGRVAVLGVVYGPFPDDVNDALDAARGLGLHYPSVFDATGKLLHAVGGNGIPVTVLVAANGRIVHVHRAELAEGELPGLVQQYLGVQVNVAGAAA